MIQNERQLIRWLQIHGGRAQGKAILGVGDDAALVHPRVGTVTILTTDLMVEGIHFLRNSATPCSIGHRALARGLSDVAAMGGRPRFVLVSLALRKGLSSGWLMDFYRGLRSLAGKFKVEIVGGDTTVSSRITMVDIVLVGEVKRGGEIRRSGGQPGDRIYVSGELGGSSLGLKFLRSQSPKKTIFHRAAIHRHLYPTPRCKLGTILARKQLASSMIDVSDGFALDLHRLCQASGVGALIEAARIPLPKRPPEALKSSDLLKIALKGGEDYELLFTAPPNKIALLPSQVDGIPLIEIGKLTKGRQIRLMSLAGTTSDLPPVGFDHFRKQNSKES